MIRPFDERLYTLKLGKLSRELHDKIYPTERRVDFEQRKIGQGHGASFYAKLVDAHLELLREFLEGVDRICREVWETQGQNMTPEFVRAVIKGHIFSAIAARVASIQGELELKARRTRFLDLATPLGSLARKRGQLESEWSERCEIEAIELEHRAKSKATQGAEDSSGGNGSGATTQTKPSQPNWYESSPAQKAQVAKKALSNRADLWRDFQDRFMRLAGEEQGRAEVITTAAALRAMNQSLRAYCTYTKHPEGWERGKPDQGMICLLDTPPHGVWNYGDGISENFRERVRLCVGEAGRTLTEYPKGADPEDFWLHRLYFDLLKNNSDSLFCASNQGGMIVSVCVASATFCCRLERMALDQAERYSQHVPASQEIDRHLGDATKKQEEPSASKLKHKGSPSRRVATPAEQPVELGQGGIRFVRQGEYTVALPCGEVFDNSTVSAVRISYDVLCIELPKAYSIVKATQEISGAQLRKQFRHSPLASVADQRDWDDWAEGFSPKNPQRGRPKGAALTFLERKMTLDRGTIKSYLSRSKNHPKRQK